MKAAVSSRTTLVFKHTNSREKYFLQSAFGTRAEVGVVRACDGQRSRTRAL